MKIAPYKIDSFINSLPQNKEIFGALIYGPESGIVSINSDKIAKSIVKNLSDPFLVSNIEQKRLEEDGALLSDEFVSMSMMGGRKLIRINNVNNKITNNLKAIFDNKKDSKKPIGTNFILISANELDNSSSLRKFAENNPYFAAIACYEDNEAAIKNIIRNKLREYNLKPENGVIELIIDKFGKNRLIILNEIDKLALYMDQNQDLTIDIVQKVIADISQISINEFINAFYNIDLKKSNFFLKKLINEKTNSITILRFLANYLFKLYVVKNNLEKGSNLESEIRLQRIFFKQEASFKRHLNLWNLSALKLLLKKLEDLEINCKDSNNNPEILLLSFNNFSFLKFKKLL